MSDSTEATAYEANSDFLSADEVRKAQQKKLYELAKSQRKEERKKLKEKKRQDRLDARSAKDALLWEALKPGSEVDQGNEA